MCIFDAKVYGEWKTGVDNEAILLRICPALICSPVMLTKSKFFQHLCRFPAASVITVFCQSTLIPAVGFVITLIFALLIKKYEKKVPQMREEIEARKAK